MGEIEILGMKTKLILLVILLSAGRAWAFENHVSSGPNIMSSTETCPSVENGVWGNWREMSILKHEYKTVELSNWTCGVYDLLIFTPWKIEWHCVEWGKIPVYINQAEEWRLINSCLREEGYREDGMLVWRRKP